MPCNKGMTKKWVGWVRKALKNFRTGPCNLEKPRVPCVSALGSAAGCEGCDLAVSFCVSLLSYVLMLHSCLPISAAQRNMSSILMAEPRTLAQPGRGSGPLPCPGNMDVSITRVCNPLVHGSDRTMDVVNQRRREHCQKPPEGRNSAKASLPAGADRGKSQAAKR